MNSHLTVHIVCDPMQVYACDNDCDVFDNNEICVVTPEKWNTHREDCFVANETSRKVNGGDALLYFHLSLGVKAKVPLLFDVDEEVTTGGWVGPYTVLLPDGGPDSDETRLRYAMTALSDFFRAPDGYTLTEDPDDFPRVVGLTALNKTIQTQGYGPAFMEDPFKDYYENCDNGDANPLLPLLEFHKGVDEDGNKTMDVSFHWHLFSYPDTDLIMHKVWPYLMDNGFPVTGPYCFNNKEIAYALDFDFDTRNASSIYSNVVMNFVAGCLPGLPCEPEIFEKCETCNLASTATGVTGDNSQLNTIIILGACLVLSTIVVLSMLIISCCLRRKVVRLEKQIKVGKKDGNMDMSTLVENLDSPEERLSATERLLSLPQSSI